MVWWTTGDQVTVISGEFAQVPSSLEITLPWNESCRGDCSQLFILPEHVSENRTRHLGSQLPTLSLLKGGIKQPRTYQADISSAVVTSC